MVKKEWIEKGYVDEPVDETLDLKEKNIGIMIYRG